MKNSDTCHVGQAFDGNKSLNIISISPHSWGPIMDLLKKGGHAPFPKRLRDVSRVFLDQQSAWHDEHQDGHTSSPVTIGSQPLASISVVKPDPSA